MIEVENISKRYGGFLAVDDVSFTVEPGEILGLLGANGAGKSTIMRILTGVFPPTSGTARVAGHDVTHRPMEVRRRVGYLPESAPLYTEMKVRPFLRFVAGVKGLDGDERDRAVEKSMADVGLSHVAGRLIGNLSRGYRQRVGIAQAIVGDPDVLILDEPTVGLDPAQVVEARDLIRDMAGRRTVILSTHILPEVSVACQKVVILHQGRVMAWGSPYHLETRFQVSSRVEIVFEGARPEDAESFLRGLPFVRSFEALRPRGAGYAFSVETTSGAAPDLARAVVDKGWLLMDLRSGGASLEDVFLQAISGGRKSDA